MTTTSRDQYLIGKLGSYDVSTIAEVDRHLRALRLRMVGAARQVASARQRHRPSARPQGSAQIPAERVNDATHPLFAAMMRA